MENFDLRKYLAENKLLKEELTYQFSEYDFDITKEPGYQEEVIKKIKSVHPDIEDDIMMKIIRNTEDYYYNEARAENKRGREYPLVGVKDFADGAIEYYEDIIMYDGDKDIEYRTDEEGKPIMENMQDEDMVYSINLLSKAIKILDEFKVSVKDEDLIKYLDTSINTYLGKPLLKLKNGKKLVDDDAPSIIQGVAEYLNPFTGEAFDYKVDDIQSDLERLIN